MKQHENHENTRANRAIGFFVPSSQQQIDATSHTNVPKPSLYDTITVAEVDWVGLAPNHGSYERTYLYEDLHTSPV